MELLKEFISAAWKPFIISIIVMGLLMTSLYYQVKDIEKQGCDYYKNKTIDQVPMECIKIFLSK